MHARDTFSYFRGKRITVMGLGLHGGGVETVKFLARAGAHILVTDLRTKKELAPSLCALSRYQSIRYVLGRHRPKDFDRTDLILKNPGVPPDSPYLLLAKKRHIPVTTDIGIFFKNCQATIIGVTGTRGKSTTAYLISKFLDTEKRHIFLGGNIRRSVLEFLEKIHKSDLVILELSSFQLQDMEPEHTSPHIAVMTNILPDHLNWHKNMREYIRAKSLIFKFQTLKDYLFINPDDPRLASIARAAPSRVQSPTLDARYHAIVDQNLGSHYRSSVALAIAVAVHLGAPKNKITQVLSLFSGLPGRQQVIRRHLGINFVNDTTSTVPEATEVALLRFRKKAEGKKLILLCGGQDKNLDFTALGKLILKMADACILLPGSATKKLNKALAAEHFSLPIKQVKSMHQAVQAATRLASRGDWVLFSPGAASFGLFKNEFDRGDQFTDEVKKHLKQ